MTDPATRPIERDALLGLLAVIDGSERITAPIAVPVVDDLLCVPEPIDDAPGPRVRETARTLPRPRTASVAPAVAAPPRRRPWPRVAVIVVSFVTTLALAGLVALA